MQISTTSAIMSALNGTVVPPDPSNTEAEVPSEKAKKVDGPQRANILTGRQEHCTVVPRLVCFPEPPN